MKSKPEILYDFIKEHVNERERCIETIANYFLAEQTEGIRTTDFVRNHLKYFRIDEKYPPRRTDKPMVEIEGRKPESNTQKINSGNQK